MSWTVLPGSSRAMTAMWGCFPSLVKFTVNAPVCAVPEGANPKSTIFTSTEFCCAWADGDAPPPPPPPQEAASTPTTPSIAIKRLRMTLSISTEGEIRGIPAQQPCFPPQTLVSDIGTPSSDSVTNRPLVSSNHATGPDSWPVKCINHTPAPPK